MASVETTGLLLLSQAKAMYVLSSSVPQSILTYRSGNPSGTIVTNTPRNTLSTVVTAVVPHELQHRLRPPLQHIDGYPLHFVSAEIKRREIRKIDESHRQRLDDVVLQRQSLQDEA
jgi:hypothetical protein